jgi:hypothetical protein
MQQPRRRALAARQVEAKDEAEARRRAHVRSKLYRTGQQAEF